MSTRIKTVAVDLTPVLPGGENGGAKIFVIELLRTLAELVPSVSFVLLTHHASHEELAELDQSNVKRYLVVGSTPRNQLRSSLRAHSANLLRRVPGRMRERLAVVAYRVNAALKRSSVPKTLLRDLNADLLFCPFTAPTYGEVGVPTVCTVYDLQYKTYPQFFSALDVVHRDHTFLEATRKATAVAAISEYSRSTALAHGKLDGNRIRTIHLRMAQRIGSTGGQHSSVLTRIDVSPRKYLIYPANFWKHKNHAMLLTAFGMARHGQLAPDVKLVCTGAPGMQRDWLISAAKGMGLHDHVVFPGYLPNADMSVLVANAAGVVFPSLYEGFGLPVIEAMAAGVPVACSNTTALPEVASGAAVLFDPRIPAQIADAITSLVSDHALRERLIAAGHERAVEFSDVRRMAREYWELFEQAVASTPQANLVSGVFADGWTGRSFAVQVSGSTKAKALEIELETPPWMPHRKLSVQASNGQLHQYPVMTLARGTQAVLSIPLSTGGGTYEIKLKPTFKYGNDPRELSAMIRRCSLIDETGEHIRLYPHEVSA